MKSAWQGPDPRWTMLAFDIFKSLHLIMTHWVQGFASSDAVFAEVEMTSGPGVPRWLILLNPGSGSLYLDS